MHTVFFAFILLIYYILYIGDTIMKNVGKIDRVIRTVLGLLLIAAGVGLQISTGAMWWLGLIGAVLLGTSALSFCPLYVPFRINTGR